MGNKSPPILSNISDNIVHFGINGLSLLAYSFDYLSLVEVRHTKLPGIVAGEAADRYHGVSADLDPQQ